MCHTKYLDHVTKMAKEQKPNNPAQQTVNPPGKNAGEISVKR